MILSQDLLTIILTNQQILQEIKRGNILI